MPMMEEMFAAWADFEKMEAVLPLGFSPWWVRGKVLHVESVERPVKRPFMIFLEGVPTRSFEPVIDRLVKLSDVSDPAAPTDEQYNGEYEIRLTSHDVLLEPGDFIELFGHRTAGSNPYKPCLALSFETNYWWVAFGPLRADQPDFVIIETPGMPSSEELVRRRWMTVNVPGQGEVYMYPFYDELRQTMFRQYREYQRYVASQGSANASTSDATQNAPDVEKPDVPPDVEISDVRETNLPPS